MEGLKAFYIIDDNGKIYDLILGRKEDKQIALTTLDYLQKSNDTSWINYRVVELETEGLAYIGHVNVIITIKMNGIPIRAIINGFYSLIDIVNSYMNIDDDYKNYTYEIEYIKFK